MTNSRSMGIRMLPMYLSTEYGKEIHPHCASISDLWHSRGERERGGEGVRES